MAYAAVISLKQTIDRLVNSCRFSLESSTRESLGSAYEKAASLQSVLKRVDADGGGRGRGRGERLDNLDGQIREAANKFEDSLELHQSDVLLHIQSEHDTVVSLAAEQVSEDIRLFVETAKKLGEDYAAELDEEGEGRSASSSNYIGGCGSGAAMVGYAAELRAMKSHVTEAVRPDDWAAASIFGRAGSGRSYVAWEVFQHERRQESFDYCVWANVGPTYHRKAILLGILSRMTVIANGGDGGGDGRAVDIEQDGMIFKVSNEGYVRCSLYSMLVGRRYMIVLDDVPDTQILESLLMAFPVQNNGSLVLVTTSSLDVRSYSRLVFVYSMEDTTLHYEDMYWGILRYLLLRLQPISPELEEAGRKVVRKCRGLFVCFTKLILFLWNTERTVEAWNQIANDQHNPIFHDVVDEISEINKIKEDFINFSVEPSDRAILSPFIEDGGISVDIGFMKQKLFPQERLIFPKMEVISFVGMTGIGKTTFVKNVFEYVQNLGHFNHCVWLTLGPTYKSEDIVIDILAQIYPVIDKMAIKGDVELAAALIEQSSDERLFIVLDDVWSDAPLEHLANSYPNIKGRALLTTTIGKVARSEKIDMVREMHFLSIEESWKLLCQELFVDQDNCPLDLEESGKKIAENCDGLPLTILKVANLLSKDLTAKYWNAAAKKKPHFVRALKELSKTLVPIYNRLPQYLKPCFLYMGVFAEVCEVSASKILGLWIDEGFLEPNPSQRVEEFSEQCLLELVDRNLVMVCQKGSHYGVETCRLNLVLWHLANDEAERINFFHAFSSYDPGSLEKLKKQRRFCIRHCTLLSIKDIYEAMLDSVATAHSLLCTGAYNPYQVPVCWELRLLRVLDTLAIRLYEFPIEAVELIHLRHLAITCGGDLPTSISKLWNLEFLMISQHFRVRSKASSDLLPMEIWDMKELRHLQVTGRNLPSPPTRATILPNLVTLLDVGYQTCSDEVLGGVPNLQKLGIRIELAPGEAPPFHHHLNRISNHLSKLESLECEVEFLVAAPPPPPPPPPLSMFPSSLEKLSLRGLGYPWKYMSILGRLKKLKVLELRGYAFRGHTWDTGDRVFENLESLVIEDTDLVCWKSTIYSFSVLKHLSIKNCYKLKEYPSNVFLKADTVQVIDCNPLSENWIELIRERNGSVALPLARERHVKLEVEFSWKSVKRGDT